MDENIVRERIVTDTKTYSGKPTIRNTRIAVEHMLGMLADGATQDEILTNYPFLEKDDIRACVVYAQQIVSSEQVEPLHKSVS
jgi:uncharacterized protein (DUF433 family)